MAMFSFLFCWLTMKLYDWSGRDWLGIEAIKGLKDYAGRSWYVQWLGWVLQKSYPVAYVLLSIKFDPFVVTAYFRRGQFNGMAPRDWRICTELAHRQRVLVSPMPRRCFRASVAVGLLGVIRQTHFKLGKDTEGVCLHCAKPAGDQTEMLASTNPTTFAPG